MSEITGGIVVYRMNIGMRIDRGLRCFGTFAKTSLFRRNLARGEGRSISRFGSHIWEYGKYESPRSKLFQNSTRRNVSGEWEAEISTDDGVNRVGDYGERRTGRTPDGICLF